MNSHRSLLGIAIVVHNDRSGLKKLLRGLRRSCPSALPLVVIENGSDLAERIRPEDLAGFDCEYISLETNHMARARNEAYLRMQCEWVCFLDSDCRVYANWYQQALSLIENLAGDPIVAAVSGPALERGPGAANRNSSLWRHFFPSLRKTARLQMVEHLPTTQIFYRRSRLIEVGGFHPAFGLVGEDLAMSRTLRNRGWSLWLGPSPVVLHQRKTQLGPHLSRLFKYGQAQGFILWVFPQHAFSARLIPAQVLTAIMTTIVLWPIASIVAIVGLTVADVMNSSRRLPLLTLLTAEISAYGFGTLIGFLKGARPTNCLSLQKIMTPRNRQPS